MWCSVCETFNFDINKSVTIYVFFNFSENKDRLESLDVTVDGEIITSERRSSIPEDLITKRRKNQEEKKAVESLKKEVIADFNDDLMKSRSVFEKSGGSDQ